MWKPSFLTKLYLQPFFFVFPLDSTPLLCGFHVMYVYHPCFWSSQPLLQKRSHGSFTEARMGDEEEKRLKRYIQWQNQTTPFLNQSGTKVSLSLHINGQWIQWFSVWNFYFFPSRNCSHVDWNMERLKSRIAPLWSSLIERGELSID